MRKVMKKTKKKTTLKARKAEFGDQGYGKGARGTRKSQALQVPRKRKSLKAKTKSKKIENDTHPETAGWDVGGMYNYRDSETGTTPAINQQFRHRDHKPHTKRDSTYRG